MKVLKKRILAEFIDTFIYEFILAIIQMKILEPLNAPDDLIIILFIPFFFKDIVFRNASIGKKILGIVIYDKQWRAPKCTLLFKRAAIMLTVGCVKLWKIFHFGDSYITLMDWEREKLGTVVIDKKVYKKLEAIAKEQKGIFSDNMTKLYNSYLRELYCK